MTTGSGNTPSRHFGWRIFPAVAVIAVGMLFLLDNLGASLGFLSHGNWWALFILVGALAPLTGAYEVYRAHGRFDAEVAGCLLGAAAVTLVASMFLLNLDWAVWWPLFVILGGLFTLVGRPYVRCYYRGAWGWHRGWRDDEDATVRH